MGGGVCVCEWVCTVYVHVGVGVGVDWWNDTSCWTKFVFV